MSEPEKAIPIPSSRYRLSTADLTGPPVVESSLKKKVLRKKVKSTAAPKQLKYYPFQEAEFIMRDVDPKMEYRRRQGEVKTVTEWGQLKLLISSVQALVTFWNPREVTHLIVVYAGAAPGDNISILIDLFPSREGATVEWHLYDNRPINVRPGANVHLHSELFTDQTAELWSQHKEKVFFFSDIRTSDYAAGDTLNERGEEQILTDMESQKRWLKIMNPYRAHLKFRLLYHTITSGDVQEYLYGYLFYQPFVAPTSTEMRLVPVRDDRGHYHDNPYDLKEYQDRLAYHNARREKIRYLLPLIEEKESPLPEGLDNRYDSVNFLSVMDRYLTFMGEPFEREKSSAEQIKDRFRRVAALAAVCCRLLSERSKVKTNIATQLNRQTKLRGGIRSANAPH